MHVEVYIKIANYQEDILLPNGFSVLVFDLGVGLTNLGFCFGGKFLWWKYDSVADAALVSERFVVAVFAYVMFDVCFCAIIRWFFMVVVS